MGYYDGYSYETTVSGGDAVSITILLIYLIVLLVWGLVSLAGYILKGIGMYTIAKRRGMDYPWLAYVPFARAYLQGELGGRFFAAMHRFSKEYDAALERWFDRHLSLLGVGKRQCK